MELRAFRSELSTRTRLREEREQGTGTLPAAAAGPVTSTRKCQRDASAPTGIVVRKGGGGVPAAPEGLRVMSSSGAAIREAMNKMTVHVLLGECRDYVVVDKDLTLVGCGETAATIVRSDAGPALTLRDCKATVYGLQLENGSTRANAVVVTDGNGWVIKGCNVRGVSNRGGRLDGGGVVVLCGQVCVCVCVCVGGGCILMRGCSNLTVEACEALRNKMNSVCVFVCVWRTSRPEKSPLRAARHGA
jgi:hypothetical protein